jgi:inner membrane transporter RhtA
MNDQERPPVRISRAERRLDAIPAELLIVAGAISIQFGAGFGGALVRGYGPLPVVALRVVFGTLLLIALRPPRISGVSREALVACLAMGVVLMAMNTCFYIALARLPLGVAVAIEFWGPLTVAVLGSRRPLDLVWVALAASGIWILTGGRLGTDDGIGVLAIFIGGGCWALYILIGGRVARSWPDGRGLSLVMLVAAVLVLPVTVPFADFTPLLTAPPALAGVVAVALFSSSIPYTLEIAALRRLSAGTFGVLLSLEPAIAALAGFLVLGQVLHPLDLVAIGCVAVASAGASITARRLRVTAGELETA